MPKDSHGECGVVVNYLEREPVLIGGGHNNMLSHVCLGHGEGLKRLSIDIHRYPPGGKSNFNVHQEQEQAYIILEGEGEVSVAGVTKKVDPGSFVFIPRYSMHAIRNLGDGELVLAFLTVFLKDGT